MQADMESRVYLSDIYHVLLTSHRAKATRGFSPKRCSWFYQCWRMPNTL